MNQRHVKYKFYDYFNPVQKVPHSYGRFGKVEFGKYDGRTILVNGHQKNQNILVELKHGRSRIGPGAVNLTKLARRVNLFRKFATGDPVPYEATLKTGLNIMEEDLYGNYENFAYHKNGNFEITHRKLK